MLSKGLTEKEVKQIIKRAEKFIKIIRFKREDEIKFKTKIFHVINKNSNIKLGTIKWKGSWRGYTFTPNYDDDFIFDNITEFNCDCLFYIADFCKNETSTYKNYGYPSKIGLFEDEKKEKKIDRQKKRYEKDGYIHILKNGKISDFDYKLGKDLPDAHLIKEFCCFKDGNYTSCICAKGVEIHKCQITRNGGCSFQNIS